MGSLWGLTRRNGDRCSHDVDDLVRSVSDGAMKDESPSQPPAPSAASDGRARPVRRTRHTIRVDVQAPGAIEGIHRISGTVKDLSLNGLFLVCPQNLPAGEEITVRFSLPLDDGNRARVEARAEVRHRERSGVGLRFLRLSFENARVIQRYLGSKETGSADG